VVDAAVLVPAQRGHAVAPDIAHQKSETPAGGGREGMGEAEVEGGEGWWWDWWRIWLSMVVAAGSCGW
jgi:hypothetical protein